MQKNILLMLSNLQCAQMKVAFAFSFSGNVKCTRALCLRENQSKQHGGHRRGNLAFRAIERRLAQMNVFSHYCLTLSANDCVFSLNEQQKV